VLCFECKRLHKTLKFQADQHSLPCVQVQLTARQFLRRVYVLAVLLSTHRLIFPVLHKDFTFFSAIVQFAALHMPAAEQPFLNTNVFILAAKMCATTKGKAMPPFARPPAAERKFLSREAEMPQNRFRRRVGGAALRGGRQNQR
jgi:hypothetical protein